MEYDRAEQREKHSHGQRGTPLDPGGRRAAGVDPISVGDIRQLVADLKKRGIGVLITDHNVRETLEIVDRAYILHEGKVLMSGTPEEVVQNENVRRVYLGDNFRIS